MKRVVSSLKIFIDDLVSKIRTNRWDVISVLVLAIFVTATRLSLITRAEFVYYVDSYVYISDSSDIFCEGMSHQLMGFPFTLVLGMFLKSFGIILGAIWSARMFMMFNSVLLVVGVYFLGKRMSGPEFGLLSGFLSIFEPYFLSYSIVPYQEVFAIGMGFLALYFAVSTKKCDLVLSLTFFLFASLARFELYVVLGIPLLFLYLSGMFQNDTKRSMTRLAIILLLYVLPLVWFQVESYHTFTRFTIIEKIVLFLTPHSVRVTLFSIVTFFDSFSLDVVYIMLCLFGLIIAASHLFGPVVAFGQDKKQISRFKKWVSSKNSFRSVGVRIGLSLILAFILCIVILAVFSYSYRIVNSDLVITYSLPVRRLILARLLMLYPLAYALSFAVRCVTKNVH